MGTLISSTEPITLFPTSRSPLTVFLVFRKRHASGQRFLINHGAMVPRLRNFELGCNIDNIGRGSFGLHRGEGAATLTPPGTIPDDRFVQMTVEVLAEGVSPHNLRIYQGNRRLPCTAIEKKGVAWPSSGAYNTSAAALDIGGRNNSGRGDTFTCFHDGEIAEILIYQVTFDDTTRRAVASYLRKRWLLDPAH
jgi:hypothetical protein